MYMIFQENKSCNSSNLTFLNELHMTLLNRSIETYFKVGAPSGILFSLYGTSWNDSW